MFILQDIILIIYLPIFLIALILAVFGIQRMIDWCTVELDFWEKQNVSDEISKSKHKG